jgi:hypothetical protein
MTYRKTTMKMSESGPCPSLERKLGGNLRPGQAASGIKAA